MFALFFHIPKLASIPIPPHEEYFGLLGNAPDLNSIFPARSYYKFIEAYGSLF